MKDTLLYLVQHIVDHPDDIVIEEQQAPERLVLVLHVNPEDMGKIIGKQGRIIRALRDLVKLMAAKQNIYVDVLLAEEQKGEVKSAE